MWYNMYASDTKNVCQNGNRKKNIYVVTKKWQYIQLKTFSTLIQYT